MDIFSLNSTHRKNWNVGMLEKWVWRYCGIGIIVLLRRRATIKIGKYPLNYPIFHHSKIPLFHD
jgi:hypothetical protein